MAQIKLYREDLDDLPEICARCGEPAMQRVTKTFSWQPPWIAVLILAGLLPYAIVAIILTKRMTVAVPLSDRHVNHWLMRNVLILGGFAVLGVMGFTGMLLLDEGAGRPNPVGGVMCVATMIGLVVWLIMTVILQQTAIRPVEITNESITLTGVCREFAEAVRQRQREYEEEEDRPRRSEKRLRDEQPPETGFRE